MSDGFTPENPLRLGVLISGGGTTLANLIDRIADGRLRAVRIVQVVSSRHEIAGNDIARRSGLPLAIIRRADCGDDASFSDAISACLDRAAVDLVAMAGFLRLWIIPKRYAGRVLNIHPALLPSFGGKGMHGRHVHEAVLSARPHESGCTVHLADNEYDHGRIIAQARTPLRPDDTIETLTRRVGELERELFPEIIQRVADRGIDALRQSVSPP